MTLHSYKELDLWKKSMDFVISIYDISSLFPIAEKYGLVSQIRRAAVSIPSNIAEGASRNNTKEFVQFLYIANGSLSEIETQLEIAVRLNYVGEISIQVDHIKQIRKIMKGLINALKEK